MNRKKAIIIDADFSGISAASFFAQEGFEVTILEKKLTPDRRVKKFQDLVPPAIYRNLEISFIRFMAQSHISEFLNYNNLEEDKGIVLEALYVNLQQEKPLDFNFTVSAIMMKSAFLNELDKKQLQKLLAKS
jgi:monoamine oxidase